MNKNNTKVMVIGLDGATFDIINPLVDKGRLPTFKMIMGNGAWGELRSTILPVTPPAWASFMTGKNPGKHGAFGFYSYKEGSYDTELATSLNIKSKKLWDYFDSAKKIGLIDIPMTFPPEKINGYMISGMPVPSEQSIFTSPPELHTEIIKEIGDYTIDRDLMLSTRCNPVESLRRLYSYTKMRKDVAEYLIREKGPFDFFMVVFRTTDFIQHAAFKFLDNDYSSTHIEETKKYGDVIAQVYERMDQYLSDLLKIAGEDCIIILMSDHGGGPLKKRFHLNRWLKKKGLLVLKNESSRGLKIEKKKISRILDRLRLSPLNKFLPYKITSACIPVLVPYLKHPVEQVDWDKTKAYANLVWTDGVIRINLKGREPNGIVDENQYDELKTYIIEELLKVADQETGQNVIESAYKREDIYSGPYVKDAPDILLITQNMEYAFTAALTGNELFEKPNDPTPANHRMNGVFMITGPNIKKGQKLPIMNIVDIAPTILYLAENVVPDDMDGKVISDAIENDYIESHSISYLKADQFKAHKPIDIQFSAEERQKIEEGLKNLGYM